MVIKLPSQQNTSLSAQEKKAIRANNPQAWAMIKKGLAPQKKLTSLPALLAGTTTSISTESFGDTLARTVSNIKTAMPLNAQTRKAIRTSNPEAWAMIKKGLVPKTLPATTTAATAKIASLVAPAESTSTKPMIEEKTLLPDAENSQSALQQAINAYANNNISAEASEIDIDELLK